MTGIRRKQFVHYLDLTFPTPAENLACDEALLDGCDAGAGPEVLRFWEPQQYFIVVGYSNRVAREVNVDACKRLGIPILRRCSGGGAVLQGPGWLNYSLVLRIDFNPALHTVTGASRFVLEQNRAALEKLLTRSSRREEALSSDSALPTPYSALAACGHTDLALGGLKFSGNAQRRKRRAVLLHGTFLLNFELALVSELLPMPSKQPEYRRGRSHGEFLRNLKAPAGAVKAALRQAWRADELLTAQPREAIQALVTEKYAAQAWNWRTGA